MIDVCPLEPRVERLESEVGDLRGIVGELRAGEGVGRAEGRAVAR